MVEMEEIKELCSFYSNTPFSLIPNFLLQVYTHLLRSIWEKVKEGQANWENQSLDALKLSTQLTFFPLSPFTTSIQEYLLLITLFLVFCQTRIFQQPMYLLLKLYQAYSQKLARYSPIYFPKIFLNNTKRQILLPTCTLDKPKYLIEITGFFLILLTKNKQQFFLKGKQTRKRVNEER